MNQRHFAVAIAAVTTLIASPASAQELFGGIAKHGVDTPFTFGTGEGGTDIQLGLRGDPIVSFGAIGGPQPYIFGSLNTSGDTNFVAAGLSWKFNAGSVYIRPGIGLAVHDGPKERYDNEGRRTDLGSRVLFEPEIGVGMNVAPRVSVEAHWSHISGARLFNSEQNPGLDMIGARVNVKL